MPVLMPQQQCKATKFTNIQKKQECTTPLVIYTPYNDLFDFPAHLYNGDSLQIDIDTNAHNGQLFTLYLWHEHQHHVVIEVGQCQCGCNQQLSAKELTTKTSLLSIHSSIYVSQCTVLIPMSNVPVYSKIVLQQYNSYK